MVYVDNRRYPYRGMLMSHMVADTTEELNEMADAIEVKRKHIQKSGTPEEHYDVCDKMRKRAVKSGAIEVNSRELVKIFRYKRKYLAALGKIP